MARSNITTATKAKAIEMFRQGRRSKSVARALGVASTTARMWYSLYSRYGERELLMPRQKNNRYSYELKVEAVQDFCDGALSVEEVLAKHNIRCRTQLTTWVAKYQDGGIDALVPKRRGKKPRDLETQETLQERCLRLEVENAYLKKLNALMDESQQQPRR